MNPVCFISYADDEPTTVDTIEHLAELAAAAIDGGCRYWIRVRLPTGERPLTPDELLVVLVAVAAIPLEAPQSSSL